MATVFSCVASRNKRGAAPGFRTNGGGALNHGGYKGYCWSCTPVTDGVTVRYLDFGTQYLYPNYVLYRGYGFQLRCLSE